VEKHHGVWNGCWCTHDIGDTTASSSFLYNGTRRMFEKGGFAYVRAKGEKNCVMTITVPAS
jgi:hypothetical protein